MENIDYIAQGVEWMLHRKRERAVKLIQTAQDRAHK
jgi:hypothetical protein